MEKQCGEENRSTRLADILENIPRSDNDAKPLSLLCPVYKTTRNPYCDGCIQTLSILLKVFDAVILIEDHNGNEIKIKNNATNNFGWHIVGFISQRLIRSFASFYQLPSSRVSNPRIGS